jgi:L-alanine-DL-glutamate epimerase-like enolase superfamily enzyme
VLIRGEEQGWPLKQVFRISRGSRTEARVVVVTVTDGEHQGRGEAVPLRRYDQTTESVLKQIDQISNHPTLDREKLQQLLPAGAARNALDCALYDLESKRAGKRAWELANISITPDIETSFTISLDAPDKMAAAAKAATESPILKLKLGGDDLDLARVEQVGSVAPQSRLLVDANESWSVEHYRRIVPLLGDLRVELIEQPFPADADAVLESLEHPVPVCADESCHTSEDLPRLTGRYEAINIKLDKTGGLTEALRLRDCARDRGFQLLIGCMVCTSLSVAPARLLASHTDWADLDGPLLLARDRTEGLEYIGRKVLLPRPELWG